MATRDHELRLLYKVLENFDFRDSGFELEEIRNRPFDKTVGRNLLAALTEREVFFTQLRKELPQRIKLLGKIKRAVHDLYNIEAQQPSRYIRKTRRAAMRLKDIVAQVKDTLENEHDVLVTEREIKEKVRDIAEQKPQLKSTHAKGYYSPTIKKELLKTFAVSRDSNDVIRACGIKNRYYLGKLLGYITYRSEEPLFKDKAVVRHLKTYKNSKDTKPHYFFSDAMIKEIKEILALYVTRYGDAITGGKAKP